MDFETVSAEEFGASLRGLGLNILVRDVEAEVRFLSQVFDMGAHRVSRDFAIMSYGDQLFQVHGDQTYHANPLPSLLPETGARGAGAEFRLYDTDPDAAEAKAEAAGGMVFQATCEKPHGLRECYLLSPAGYAWVPSRPIGV